MHLFQDHAKKNHNHSYAHLARNIKRELVHGVEDGLLAANQGCPPIEAPCDFIDHLISYDQLSQDKQGIQQETSSSQMMGLILSLCVNLNITAGMMILHGKTLPPQHLDSTPLSSLIGRVQLAQSRRNLCMHLPLSNHVVGEWVAVGIESVADLSETLRARNQIAWATVDLAYL